MFTAKIYDITDGEDFIGYATFDDETGKLADVSSGWEHTDELEAALMGNVEEIIDLHSVLMEDPDAEDTMGVELDTPEQEQISIVLTHEEEV